MRGRGIELVNKIDVNTTEIENDKVKIENEISSTKNSFSSLKTLKSQKHTDRKKKKDYFFQGNRIRKSWHFPWMSIVLQAAGTK